MLKNLIFLILLAFYIVPAIGDINRSSINLRDTKERIGLAQIFDYKISEKERLNYAPDIVWGANKPWISTFSTYYVMLERDPDRSHTPSWYQKNSPEQLVYQCDEKNLANIFSYDFGIYSPIDIENDSVREYLFKNYIEPAINKGFNAIGIDNVVATNLSGKCGIKKNGSWYKKYSGDRKDPRNVIATINYLKWLRSRIKNDTKIAINLTYDKNDIAGYHSIASAADIIFDETGFSRKCLPLIEGLRERLINLSQIAQKKSLVIIDQVCDDKNNITTKNIESSLAKFLLIKGNYSYLAITPGEKYGEIYTTKFDTLKFSGATEIKENSDGLLLRQFDNGFVIVNADEKKSIKYKFSAEKEYALFSGEIVKNYINLSPGMGAIVIYH
jgi:hypothetical protein